MSTKTINEKHTAFILAALGIVFSGGAEAAGAASDEMETRSSWRRCS